MLQLSRRNELLFAPPSTRGRTRGRAALRTRGIKDFIRASPSCARFHFPREVPPSVSDAISTGRFCLRFRRRATRPDSGIPSGHDNNGRLAFQRENRWSPTATLAAIGFFFSFASHIKSFGNRRMPRETRRNVVGVREFAVPYAR